MPSLSRQSLSGKVYDHLLAQLSLRKLRIGERINARKVTDALAVSRTTVTKAVERLVKAGHVKVNGIGRPIVTSYPTRKKTNVECVFDFANQTDNTYEKVLERILCGGVGEQFTSDPGDDIVGGGIASTTRTVSLDT